LDDKKPRRVVILGGGFGGIHTFKGLRKLIKKEYIELTLIDNSDHFLFTPFLHEVAVGKIRDSSCRILLSEILQDSNVHFLRARVLGIDMLSRTVCTDLKTITYDGMLFSLGKWMAGAELKVYSYYISKVFCVWGIAAVPEMFYQIVD